MVWYNLTYIFKFIEEEEYLGRLFREKLYGEKLLIELGKVALEKID